MKNGKLKTFVLLSLATCVVSMVFLLPIQAEAQRLFPTIAPTCDQTIVNTAGHFTTNKTCGFDDFIQLFINLFDWGLAILSILSIIFFLIGGTMLLVSAGKEQTIQQGKAILANTFLGIVVALGGWLIINTVVGLLVGNGAFKNVEVFGENWWGVKASCTDQYKTVCLHNNLQNGCGDIETTYVKELQSALNNAPGCSEIARLSEDGCFGNQTENVVKAFNEAQTIAGNAAIKETWDALSAGKGCSKSGGSNNQTIASENPGGCCVTQCAKNGFNQTHQGGDGTNGCLDVYANGVGAWTAGSCTADASLTTGCCVLLNSRGCIQGANKAWCSYKSGALANGVYYDQSCASGDLAAQCSGSTVQCN